MTAVTATQPNVRYTYFSNNEILRKVENRKEEGYLTNYSVSAQDEAKEGGRECYT